MHSKGKTISLSTMYKLQNDTICTYFVKSTIQLYSFIVEIESNELHQTCQQSTNVHNCKINMFY